MSISRNLNLQILLKNIVKSFFDGSTKQLRVLSLKWILLRIEREITIQGSPNKSYFLDSFITKINTLSKRRLNLFFPSLQSKKELQKNSFYKSMCLKHIAWCFYGNIKRHRNIKIKNVWKFWSISFFMRICIINKSCFLMYQRCWVNRDTLWTIAILLNTYFL